MKIMIREKEEGKRRKINFEWYDRKGKRKVRTKEKERKRKEKKEENEA